jgi:hypothetical protein
MGRSFVVCPNVCGESIIGGPAGEAPEFVAAPHDDD